MTHDNYPASQDPLQGAQPVSPEMSQAQLAAPEALLPGVPKTLDVANLEPLRQEGNAVLLATASLGARNPIHVWAAQRNDGTLQTDGVVLAREGVDIQDALRRSRERKKGEPYSDILPVRADGNPVILGRTNYRDVLRLTDGASREHAALSVAHDAKSGRMTITFKDMSSHNGTFLRYREKVPEVSAVEESTTDIPQGIGYVAVGTAGVEKVHEKPAGTRPSGLPPAPKITGSEIVTDVSPGLPPLGISVTSPEVPVDTYPGLPPPPKTMESEPLVTKSSGLLPPPPERAAYAVASNTQIAEQDGQELPADQAALKDLKETWGLPEDATAEQAAIKLQETVEHIDRALVALSHDGNLTSNLGKLRDKLQQTLVPHRVQFNRELLGDVQGLLAQFGRDMQPILARGGILLSGRTKIILENDTNQITRFSGQLDNLINSGGMVDTDMAQDIYNALRQDPVTALAQQLMHARQTVEEKHRTLTGHDIASSYEQESVEKFADQFIADYAAKIRGGNLTQEQLDGYAVALERALDTAIEMNKNNPSGLPFGDLVVKNTNKKREGGAKMGQADPSRIVTAELMVDMLRGAYDFDKGNSSPITVDAAGKIEIGQHRAAALMTLYGRHWREEATKAGHVIVDKVR